MPPTPELVSLTLVSLFTGVIWIPIILNRMREMGLWRALRNPEPDVRPDAAWAYRMSQAHRNAIENLVVFAPLAVTVSLLGKGDALTHTAAFAFLWARIAHTLIYTFGVPLLRTIAFFIGFLSQMILGLRILDMI